MASSPATPYVRFKSITVVDDHLGGPNWTHAAIGEIAVEGAERGHPQQHPRQPGADLLPLEIVELYGEEDLKNYLISTKNLPNRAPKNGSVVSSRVD